MTPPLCVMKQWTRQMTQRITVYPNLRGHLGKHFFFFFTSQRAFHSLVTNNKFVLALCCDDGKLIFVFSYLCLFVLQMHTVQGKLGFSIPFELLSQKRHSSKRFLHGTNKAITE